MHTKNITAAGMAVTKAKKALIMVHGRGASAHDILSLADYFDVTEFALLAPQAAGNTWYPHSFVAPLAQNEPYLSSALQVLKEVITEVEEAGIAREDIYLLGFSQGACLSLEFAAQNAARYGGVVAFSGGLIGERLYPERYTGNFGGTPIFIGSSNPDFHIPVERVHASASLLSEMGARVTKQIYPNMGHTINGDEIAHAAAIFKGETFSQP